MNFIQKRWKAVAAFVTTYGSVLYAYYQANPNLTLKAYIIGFVGSLISAGAVHQVTNQV